MDEKLKFVARLLDDEKMAGLCREFGILRPIGYKLFNRYKESGLHGLNDHADPIVMPINYPFKLNGPFCTSSGSTMIGVLPRYAIS